MATKDIGPGTGDGAPPSGAPPPGDAAPLSRWRLGAALALAVGLLAGGVFGLVGPSGRAAAATPPAVAVPLAARAAAAAAPAHTVAPVNCDATPWLCGIVSSTWQRITDPTYSGPGTNPIEVSYCRLSVCQFNTGGGGRDNGRFVVVLPPGFASKIQGGSGWVKDGMPVIRAMLALNPAKYGVPQVTSSEPSFTVASSYAAHLQAAGISPAAFLAWLMTDLPSSQVRQDWHCGVFGCTGTGFDVGTYTALPAGEQGGVVRRVPVAVAAVTHTTVAAVAHVTQAVGRAGAGAVAVVSAVVGGGAPKAGGGGRGAKRQGSPTASAGGGSTARDAAKGAAATTTASVSPVIPRAAVGTVITEASGCPTGQSLLVAPTGPRCMPDVAVGVHTGWRWWDWVAASLGGLLVLWGVAYAWRRHTDAIAG